MKTKVNMLPSWSELGSNKPSQQVRDLADFIGGKLAKVNLIPNSIVLAADGDIDFYFFIKDDSYNSPLRYASIVCTTENELVLSIVDRTEGCKNPFEATAFSTSILDVNNLINKLINYISNN